MGNGGAATGPLTHKLTSADPWPVHRSFPGYRPTPLRSRPDLADQTGVGQVLVKDESHRFGLSAFKALGASYALAQARRRGEAVQGAVCTATEGNHGRAVAWASRYHGLDAHVYVPEQTERARIHAIEGEGAQVVQVTGDYEAAVERARSDAEREGWLLVQDTAWPGYTEIPLQIMQGYTTVFREVEAGGGGFFEDEPPAEGGSVADADPPADVVFLQAGVGSWAAAGAAYLKERWGSRAPRVVVVEPLAAACVQESVSAGSPSEAGGNRRTAMNGLNCGVPSTLAYDVLANSADAFVAVGEAWARDAVAALEAGTPAIRSAPAGAAGLAGLYALTRGAAAVKGASGGTSNPLGLGPESRVLVVNTEGAGV